MKSNALGVVVVRLQVPELHAGHRYLLNSVTAIHKNVLVVIGETEARLTPGDPLTYEMRAAMLKAAYPMVEIARLPDMPDDGHWSRTLDLLIADAISAETSTPVVLYGGRDSFLKHYCGACRTFELPPVDPISGTEIREAVEVKNSPDFRAGMIYASKFRYPTSYQCVDVAIMRDSPAGPVILLGQKKIDNGKWRFIGGFVSPQDATLEHAARREVREETGLEPGDVTYIGSRQVGDYRYPEAGSDRLMTALFLMRPAFGAGVAADDIDAVQWIGVDAAEASLASAHLPLYALLKEHLNG